jgi:hypothetical protein
MRHTITIAYGSMGTAFTSTGVLGYTPFYHSIRQHRLQRTYAGNKVFYYSSHLDPMPVNWLSLSTLDHLHLGSSQCLPLIHNSLSELSSRTTTTAATTSVSTNQHQRTHRVSSTISINLCSRYHLAPHRSPTGSSSL